MPFKRRENITQEDRDWNNMMDPKIQNDRLLYILDNGQNLTSKELDFLSNMSIRLTKHYELTEPQAKWLTDIYNRID